MSRMNAASTLHGGVRSNHGSRQQVIMSSVAGVQVPAKFSGIQNTAYPASYSAAPNAPNLTCTSARERSHDIAGGCSQWRALNTANGAYDATAVARLDAWIDQCYSDGREVIFTLYGTPAWAADTSINFTDQYGHQYAANAPADVGSGGSASLSAFVTWLVSRYNGSGTRKIHYLELWNEPLFSTVASSYFSGTPVKLAQMGKGAYQAAKAVDAGIVVLSPGFAGMAGGLDPMAVNYLNAAVGDGTFGKDWCDGVTYHPYDLGTSSHPFCPIATSFSNFLAAVGAAAPGKLIYCTEQGYLHNWTGVSQTERAKVLKQSALIQAAFGVQFVQWYSASGAYASGSSVSPTYVADNIIGGPLSDPTIIDAFNWIGELSGLSIYEVGYLGANVMYADTSVGRLVA